MNKRNGKLFIRCSLLCALLISCTSCFNAGEHARKLHITDECDVIDTCQIIKEYTLALNNDITYITNINGDYIFKADLGNFFYYIFDKDFLLSDSLGRRGRGNKEFLFPHLLNANDDMLLFDHTRRESFIAKETLVPIPRLNIEGNPNKLRTIRWPYVGCYHFVSDSIIWNVVNAIDGKISFSIAFNDETNKPEAYLQTFTWDSEGNHVAFAYKYYNRIRICSLTDRMDLLSDDIYSFCNEYDRPKESKCYYTDVICYDDLFCALSQKNMSIFNDEWSSEIEIFDYEGNNVRKIILDGAYSQMIKAENSRELSVLSVDGQTIKTIILDSSPSNSR